jgi:hypothetical protein
MIITKEILNKLRPYNGRTLDLLGLSRNPKKGWKDRLIGTQLNPLLENQVIKSANLKYKKSSRVADGGNRKKEIRRIVECMIQNSDRLYCIGGVSYNLKIKYNHVMKDWKIMIKLGLIEFVEEQEYKGHMMKLYVPHIIELHGYLASKEINEFY